MLDNVTRILLVRTDRIGDLVLTTPAFAALRAKLPEAHLVALVSGVGLDVVKNNPQLNAVLVLDRERHSGLIGFFRLWREIRAGKFQAAVLFHTDFKTAFAVWLAGVGYRLGPLSKWWSWFLYNRGRRQNRSSVEMHEADYNIQLLHDFGITVAGTRARPELQVGEKERASAKQLLAERGLHPRYKTVAIHPGMGGSALNWPESHYVRLGRHLLKKYNVLVTGGPAEAPLVDRVLQGITQEQAFLLDRPTLAKYLGEGTLSEFIAVLDCCDGVVAPSTGPMHLATALGKKVVTIFSPIRVQSAVRWGPYGVASGTNLGISPQDQVSVLVPDVNCAENFKCALQACIYYPCMPRVPVEDVETQLLVLLEGGDISMFKSSGLSGYGLEESYGDLDL